MKCPLEKNDVFPQVACRRLEDPPEKQALNYIFTEKYTDLAMQRSTPTMGAFVKHIGKTPVQPNYR